MNTQKKTIKKVTFKSDTQTQFGPQFSWVVDFMDGVNGFINTKTMDLPFKENEEVEVIIEEKISNKGNKYNIIKKPYTNSFKGNFKQGMSRDDMFRVESLKIAIDLYKSDKIGKEKIKDTAKYFEKLLSE